mmetsp:Transcript_13243/g.13194  ORF Transcript_13243/g.13194 Transcript_13243/m.13194 type:complete len:80 (+) Transcript_13243:1026-1265(+)
MLDKASPDIRREHKYLYYKRRSDFEISREKMREYEHGDFKKLDDLILPGHEEFKDFIKYLVQIDPTKRPSAHEALKHNF